jgi:hypothetical protein
MAYTAKIRKIGYPWKTVIAGQYLYPPRMKPARVSLADYKMPHLMGAGQRSHGGGIQGTVKGPVDVFVTEEEDATGQSKGQGIVRVRFPTGNLAHTHANDKLRADIANGVWPVASLGGGMGLNIYGEKLVAVAGGKYKPVGEPPPALYPVEIPTQDPGAPPPPDGTGPAPGGGVIGQIVGGQTAGVPTWLLIAGLVGGIWWWRSRR